MRVIKRDRTMSAPPSSLPHEGKTTMPSAYLLLLHLVALSSRTSAAVDPAKQQTLRGADAAASASASASDSLAPIGAQKAPPSCAAKDPVAFGRNDGHWERDMFRSPLYTASSCSYMQHKFTCGTGRSARINRWAWRQAATDGGQCHNTDFAHDDSAAVNDEFLTCTANKTVVMMGDSNTRNSFVGLLCRFHNYFPPYKYDSYASMEDSWMPHSKKLKQGENPDPLYRDSHYTAFNGLSLHFSSVYFSPQYDFPGGEWKKKTAVDIVMLPFDQVNRAGGLIIWRATTY